MISSITARAIVYNQYGEPKDEIKCHSYKINLENLKPDDIVVESIACPINPSDINQIQGVYPSKPPLSLTSLPNLNNPAAVTGNEGLFKVIAKGSNVNNFENGDWCIPKNVNFGTWCTHKSALNNEFIKIPKTISINEAATIAVNPSSAYQMLTYFEKLQPGDWFIQNGANSQVGRAAIQIAKKLGLNSLNIVRNRDNINELKNDLISLGATKVITEDDNNSKDFGKTIKSWLNGKEIKLGLNCVGGSSVTGLARKLGHDATLLTYGGMSMKPVILPTSLFIFKNLTAKGFWITGNITRFPNSRLETIEAVIKMMEDGDIVEPSYEETNVKISELTDDKLLEIFVNGLINSKQGKQLIKFE
ncbi:mitochondrial 2-enoyl thioester reductase [Pichia californica]|uniref:Mitochondrial 2-enoyl thioester reductase n=1 Tax=Pichia californica TaxID=460514 RepID=A0A9P7BDR7_9ASCO|nr:mitochondrial 2-enoyl thioester reductase [[Candida] californica]